jgi:hypothetical protein
MPFKAGTVAYVAIDGVAGAPVNVSSYADNFTWPQTTQTLNVSAFGTAAQAFIPGLTDGDTISVSGPLDVALGTFLAGLKGAQSAGSSTATVIWGPGGSVSGQLKIQAEAWVTQYNVTTSVTGRVEYSASLQVTGAVTNGTW